MRPVNQTTQKYETIRVTPEAKEACLKAALEEGVKQGRRVPLSEVASRLIMEGFAAQEEPK